MEEVRSLELEQKLRTAVLGAVNSTIVMMGPALSEEGEGGKGRVTSS